MEPISQKCDVLSCIQPSGVVHLGNYFGAIKNWVQLQDTHNCIFGIVDLHAMTEKHDPVELKKHTNQMMIDLITCGIDPQKSTLFVQSLVPEHVELSWILGTLASYGEVSRQVQFKEKSKRKKEEAISVGLFSYPLLQAADILIYRAKEVPVGQDQKQHLELTRNIAERFNSRYGDFFPIPEPRYSETPKLMSLADPTKKMSKNLGAKHYIGLFETEKSVRKKVAAAITDSGELEKGKMSPGVETLFALLGQTSQQSDYISLRNDFLSGNLKYQHLKEAVANAMVELTTEMRQRRAEAEADISLINDSIREMSIHARKLAQETLYEVKQRVGIKNLSHF